MVTTSKRDQGKCRVPSKSGFREVAAHHRNGLGGSALVKRRNDVLGVRFAEGHVSCGPLRNDEEQHRDEPQVSLNTGDSERRNAGRATAASEGSLVNSLREANENLVVASMNSQTMTEEAVHAGVVKEQFLATLAHELRNPLAPVMNALEILRRLDSPDPMVAWACKIISRQVGHMTLLINDLLDVSRINSGRIQLDKRPVRIDEVMQQTIEMSSPAINGRNQTLTVDIPREPLIVAGDRERLVQVLSNLLDNAAKYTQEGGEIRFTAERAANSAVLRVSDNGCGIEADVLPHVFELFTQEDRSLHRSKGGLGIGLAVARGISELHGGTISASSGGAGKGSEFSVTLPLME